MNCEILEKRNLLGFIEVASSICEITKSISSEIIHHPWSYAATTGLLYVNFFNGFNDGYAAEELPISHFTQELLIWSNQEIISALMFATFSEGLRCNPFQSLTTLSNLFHNFPSTETPTHNKLLSLFGSSIVFITIQSIGSAAGYAASLSKETLELFDHMSSLMYCDC